jgi:DNA-binding transcriptional regulator YhcF (GntR family)
MEQTYAELSEISFTEAEVRCAVVMALVRNNGEVDNRTIANTLGVDMRTIQRTRKKLEESKDPRGVITRAPKSPDDLRKSRDADFVKRVQTMIDNDPSQSMRSMAAELRVDKRTIQRCVDEDLRCKSYRMQTGQLLTQATKDRRLLKSIKLLNKLKHPKESNPAARI